MSCKCRLQVGPTASRSPGEEAQAASVDAAAATEASFDDSPLPQVDLSRVGPMRLVLQEVVYQAKPGHIAAILQVIPERPPGPYDPALPMPVR